LEFGVWSFGCSFAGPLGFTQNSKPETQNCIHYVNASRIQGIHSQRERDRPGGRRHYRFRFWQDCYLAGKQHFMPIMGLLLGRVDFSNLFIVLNGQHAASVKEAADKGIPVFTYGLFVNTVIEFLIIAFCLFIVIKQVNRFKKPAAAPGPSGEEKLLTEIRDLLKTERRA
jgi:large conductance mechanosensitive channel